jgi:tRNA 2-thiouridine synthesizing protein A
MSESRVANGVSLPHPDAVLEMLDTAATSGAICALLTPAMKGKLREMEPGQVLLVRVDDPSAWVDVQAWCSLTGNVLQATREEGGVISFYIKKKEDMQSNG